ncbi:MAG: TIGR04255 family protein [Cytophagales bacterium]|nr:TIGR04255 family protein [Cytophagales bacterium]
MEIPKKIEICPIVDCVIEIRFSTTIFPNAVFGIIFTALQQDFPKVEKLPILQLPEQLRDSDPNLKFKALYKLMSEDNYSVQVGPDVLVIGAPIPYPGWGQLFDKIQIVIEKVFQTNVISQVSRLGVRFINFFDEDIFPNIKLDISINETPLASANTQLRAEIAKHGFSNNLNISNSATQQLPGNKKRVGSIIDIDTFKVYKQIDFRKIYTKEIETAHLAEKEIFFGLLNNEFLQDLKPVY